LPERRQGVLHPDVHDHVADLGTDRDHDGHHGSGRRDHDDDHTEGDADDDHDATPLRL